MTCEGPPTGIHAKNFETIVTRWHELWPEFRSIITELMVSYGREKPDWSRVNSVYIDDPCERVIEGAEWSMGVVFSDDTTLWSLPYDGWSACPRKAQAIY